VLATALYIGIGQPRIPWPKLFASRAPLPVAVPAPPETTASVISARLDVYDRPSESGRRIASLARGAGVAVARLPLSVFQEWVAVEVPADRSQPAPGYARMAELGDWSSRNPASAVKLLEMFAPGERDAEIRAEEQTARIEAALSSAVGPDAARARLDRAALFLWLARARDSRGLPFERWRGYLDSASADLAAADFDPSLRAEVASGRAAILSMMPAPPEPQPTTSARKITAEKRRPTQRGYRANLARVEEYWRSGQYDAASRELSMYEAQNPGDAAGHAWRDRLGAAERIEKEGGR
jgi:hypothetical protein